jgi:hypothetical protein
MNKEQLLKAIKGHRLYKLYHSPTKEIPRDDLQGEVNPSGQATSRLFDLKRRLKDVVKRTTDFPHSLVRDNDELQQLVQTAIVTLYADGDGRIDNADFRRFFDPLAGMVEGIIAAMNADDPAAMQDMRLMKVECKHKAFMQQLKKLCESDKADGARLGKALSSMLTHVFILGEKTGGVNESLVSRLTSMVESLKDPAKAGEVLAQVRSWGLFEQDKGMAPVKVAQGMPKSQDKKQAGLDATNKDVSTTAKGQPTGEDRWKGDKDGKGKKAELKPNLLTQAPGNPEDEAAGKGADEIEPNQLPKDNVPASIDGQPNKPNTKNYPATKEAVELKITEETAVRVKYAIVVGGKQIGEATLNRRSRLGKLRGKLEDAREFEATSPAHARRVVGKLLATA